MGFILEVVMEVVVLEVGMRVEVWGSDYNRSGGGGTKQSPCLPPKRKKTLTL